MRNKYIQSGLYYDMHLNLYWLIWRCPHILNHLEKDFYSQSNVVMIGNNNMGSWIYKWIPAACSQVVWVFCINSATKKQRNKRGRKMWRIFHVTIENHDATWNFGILKVKWAVLWPTVHWRRYNFGWHVVCVEWDTPKLLLLSMSLKIIMWVWIIWNNLHKQTLSLTPLILSHVREFLSVL